jgi:hypothetical protein
MTIKSILCAAALIATTVSSANAEVTAISLKFKGGCSVASTGTCTLSVKATGSDFSGDSFLIQRAETRGGSFKKISNRLRTYNETGSAAVKFKNVKGCYRAISAPNGNDVADVRSNTICEK